MDNIAFNKATLVGSIDAQAKEEKKKIQNTFVHILVEKGGILATDEKTENVREVIFDTVYCYPDDKKTDEFINAIKGFGETIK